jgi:parallel beta-helix repeat protein
MRRVGLVVLCLILLVSLATCTAHRAAAPTAAEAQPTVVQETPITSGAGDIESAAAVQMATSSGSAAPAAAPGAGATSAAQVGTILRELSYTTTIRPGESIQAAIDAAPAGAVITLAAGEWQENVTIGKSLTLCGEGMAAVRGREAAATVVSGRGEDDPVIRVYTPSEEGVSVVLTRLAVNGGKGLSGLLIEGNAVVAVTDCVVSDNVWIGIFLADSSQASITGCTVSGSLCNIKCAGSKATISDSTVSAANEGVAVWGVATIIGCSILGNTNGITLRDSAKVTISDCTISGNPKEGSTDLSEGKGIGLTGSAQANINRCTISGNKLGGVILADTAQATIDDCSIEGQLFSSFSFFCVFLEDVAQIAITNSSVSMSPFGIGLTGSARAAISDCTFFSLGVGVLLVEKPCFNFDETLFTGYVTGGGNAIAASPTDGSKMKTAVCPNELDFLMAEEGGELDRR